MRRISMATREAMASNNSKSPTNLAAPALLARQLYRKSKRAQLVASSAQTVNA